MLVLGVQKRIMVTSVYDGINVKADADSHVLRLAAFCLFVPAFRLACRKILHLHRWNENEGGQSATGGAIGAL